MKILVGMGVWAITFAGVWSLCRAAAQGDKQIEQLERSRYWPEGLEVDSKSEDQAFQGDYAA